MMTVVFKHLLFLLILTCPYAVFAQLDLFAKIDAVVLAEQSLDPVLDTADFYFTRDRSLANSCYEYYYTLADQYPQWHHKGDSVRSYQASLYNWHAFELLGYDISLSERLVDTAYSISQAIGDSVTINRCYYCYGTIARVKGENYKALDYYNQYVDYYSEPFDSVAMSNVNYQIGSVYSEMGQFGKSTEYFLECARLDEGLGREESNRWTYEALAIDYRKLRQYDKALEYNDRALSIFEQIKDTSGVGRSLFNRGNIYTDLDSFEIAISNQQAAIDLLNGFSSKHFLGSAYESLGLTYLKAGNNVLAEENLHRGLELSQKHNEQKQINIAKANLSKAKLKTNKPKAAIALLSEVYGYAKENQELAQLSSITQQLSEAYEQEGQLKQALDFRKEHQIWQDSLFSKNMLTAVNDAEAKYQSEINEAEIGRLHLEDELNQTRISRQRLALGGTTVGLGLLSFLLYRIFGQKKQIEKQNGMISKALSEKDTLLREIHHRVKNNLQVISSLLRIQSNQTTDEVAIEALKEGQSRVQSMSLLHQDLYQHDNLKGIIMSEYLDRLTRGLFDTYNISPDRIKLSTDISDLVLDVDTVVPLGLIINELITNSLKYAFPNGRQGKIEVTLREHTKQLVLTIEDDGIGIDPSTVESGFGNGLIQAFANKLDADIRVESESGTRITITISDYHKVLV